MPDLSTMLAADGPNVAMDERRQLYAPLIGAWDVDATWYRPDGSRRRAKVEWRFDWVLGGRGVQDVLGRKDGPADEYGTSIRCYDADADAWRVLFVAPVAGEFVTLVARRVGDDIVQEGSPLGGGSLQRWTFSEITPDGFLWRGEASDDDGLTWRLQQEMRGTRRAG
jgi:hypothetical protein